MTQENRGVAETRNGCVALARGKYVSFMDQDDMMKPDYLEKLVEAAERGDADIAICGYVHQCNDAKVLKTVEITRDSWSKYRMIAPWGRIYKKDFLVSNGLKFLTTTIGEDMYLTVNAYAVTKKIEVVENYAGYIWRYNEASVSNTSQKKATIAKDACETFEKILEALPEDRVSDPVDEEYFFIRSCLYCLLFSVHGATKEQINAAYDCYFSFLKKHFPSYRKNAHIGLFKLKSEEASVRLIVWAFIAMQRIGFAKAFVRIWSKISK
jgi:glycosyltransferase involved in cell wall biosynthesis